MALMIMQNVVTFNITLPYDTYLFSVWCSDPPKFKDWLPLSVLW